MGATSVEREPGQSNRDFVQEEILGDRYRILDAYTGPGDGCEWSKVFYAAVETLEPTPGFNEAGEVWGLVVLMHGTAGRGWFTYKEVTEEMGPCDDGCPTRILDKLTPTDSEEANRWRERCRKRAAALDALRAGEPVRFPYFGRASEEPVRVVDAKRGTFKGQQTGTLYRLLGWKSAAFEVVTG